MKYFKLCWLSVCEKAPNRMFQSEESSSSSQFSVVCIFNWMLGQLRKSCRKIVSGGKIVYLWKSSELKSTEQCERKNIKSHPRSNSVIRAILSRVYVQLDARPIKEGCG